ncbi:MAG: hypothetical protein EZS28_018446 [Streblomastix strix]|uniref:Uncharacterized protein n=1 Tax=Streblomastix strix TaxID=222440 RepID=A0A5J4VV11_9EUKA|nr:MAG: hypothetical protein EZS28_018446 [Streblomastix strix]
MGEEYEDDEQKIDDIENENDIERVQNNNKKSTYAYGHNLRTDEIAEYDPDVNGKVQWSDWDQASYLDILKKLSAKLLYLAIETISIIPLKQEASREKQTIIEHAEAICSTIAGLPSYIHEMCDLEQMLDDDDNDNYDNKDKRKKEEEEEEDDDENEEEEEQIEDESEEEENEKFEFKKRKDKRTNLQRKIVMMQNNDNEDLGSEEDQENADEIKERYKNGRLTLEQLTQINPKQIKRADRMVNQGRIGDSYSRISDTAEGIKILEPGEQTYKILMELLCSNNNNNNNNNKSKPSNKSDIKQSPNAPSPHQIFSKFTLEMFEQVIRSIKRGTAPGPTGWSGDAIKKLCLGNQAYMRLMFHFYKACIFAQFYPRAFFFQSAIAIKKEEKPKPRPITIPEAMDKIMAKIILKLEDRAYQNGISATQMGVKKKWGSEKIINLIQVAIDTQIIKQEDDDEKEEEEEEEEDDDEESNTEEEEEEEEENKDDDDDNNDDNDKYQDRNKKKKKQQKQIQKQEQKQILQQKSSASTSLPPPPPTVLSHPGERPTDNINSVKNKPLIAQKPTPTIKITIQQKPISNEIFNYNPLKPRKNLQQQPNESKQIVNAETQQTGNKNKKNIIDKPKKGDNGKTKETSKNQTTTKIYKDNELDEQTLTNATKQKEHMTQN